jgi:hypothetical protein
VTGRGARRATGLLWPLLLLVVLPIGLIHVAGWPLPRHWPTHEQWRQYTADPLTPRAVTDLFAIGLWLIWAVLLYALLADLTSRIRRAARSLSKVRLPLPAAMQATASGLLGAAVFSTGTATAHANAVTQPAATAPATPAVVDPSAPTTALPDPSISAADQVQVPGGGWVTHRTAAAIAASAATVWHQRRRRYVPRPLTPPPRTDADLSPLPPTVTAITEQLQPSPDEPLPYQARPDTQQPVPADSQPTRGEHAGRLVQASDLPAGGVGLTGPAALDAARGFLIAALFTAQESDPDPRVISTRAALATLQPAADEYRDLPGLRVAHDLPAAVNAVESIALRRAAAADEHTGPTPPVLVLVNAPPAGQTDVARRLALVLTLAARDAVNGVVIGRWQAGATWDVGPGGTADPGRSTPGGQAMRLSVLDAIAATDLLTVYREAHARPATTSAAHTQLRDTPKAPAPLRQPDPPRQRPSAPTPAAAGRSTASHVRLTALGTPAVYPATEDTALHLPRTAALPVLVFLALHPSGAATQDLSKALWPQLHPNTTADRVYTIMGTLKQILNPAAGGPIVIRDGDRYRLNPHHVEVDLWQLRAAVHAAATATNDAARSDALRQIVDLYHGDLADGWTWSWLDPPREATRRYLIDARAALAAEHDDLADQR